MPVRRVYLGKHILEQEPENVQTSKNFFESLGTSFFGCDKVILTVIFNVTIILPGKKIDLEKFGRYIVYIKMTVGCTVQYVTLIIKICFAYYRHYRQAYSLLGELKSSDINMLEIKVVAGFVNYKVFVFRI